ncbi:MAG TPA: 3-deoxy-manno-octulosonate cytidylyltransferase [Lachnospiraceae bacterium]|nr:3-deoxy-manno-octulosonate cytidylyltransferase [Lachnospiraceae bacterium]
MKTLGVVASRYASTRFPGKALADIYGRPMVWWVYQQALKSARLDELIVATDDARIEAVCKKYDMNVIMTSDRHPTTASRMLEVSQKIAADFYVTINGDEPMIDPMAIDAAVPDRVLQDTEFGTNTICPFTDPVGVVDPTNIKVVFDDNFKALYMSRTPIPYPYASLAFKYYKHVGVIGYNRKMLEFYGTSTPGRFEKIEGIDTLRFIDYGKLLQFCPAEIRESLSVDTPKDLEKVCGLMKEEGLVDL